MSFRDRLYAGGGENDAGSMGQIGRQIGLPRPTPMTLMLIGLNALVALIMILLGDNKGRLVAFMDLEGGRRALQAWRFITFQFVHGGASHFLWNMVGLYFFGPPLERVWGKWRFLAFYLLCGIGGGLVFQAIAAIWAGPVGPGLIGASGGILGCVMACAILFPEMTMLIIPIRWVAGFLVALYVLSVVWEKNLSNAAHLGGMATAALWIWAERRGVRLPAPRALTNRVRQGLWERRLRERDNLQQEIDRILQKIHDQGLNSLTGREKRLLKKATEAQREEDRRVRRL